MSPPCTLIDDLPPTEREEVEALLRTERHADGAVIFAQGSPGDRALWIREGEVRLCLELPGEQRVEVARLGPGEVFGELALLHPGPRSLEAEAVGPVVLDGLHHEDFQGLRHAFRPASFRLLRGIARRMAGHVVHADTRTRAGTEVAGGAGSQAAPLGAEEEPGCAFDPMPFLAHLPFFARFAPPDRAALLERGRLWQLPRGRVILRQGDHDGGIFAVVRGAVEVVGAPGTPRLALVGPGGLVGVLAPLLAQPAIATCRMREAGTVLHLDEAALAQLLQPVDRLSYRFLHALCRGLIDDVVRAGRVLARVEGARALARPEG